jgi:hypothetical protein
MAVPPLILAPLRVLGRATPATRTYENGVEQWQSSAAIVVRLLRRLPTFAGPAVHAFRSRSVLRKPHSPRRPRSLLSPLIRLRGSPLLNPSQRHPKSRPPQNPGSRRRWPHRLQPILRPGNRSRPRPLPSPGSPRRSLHRLQQILRPGNRSRPRPLPSPGSRRRSLHRLQPTLRPGNRSRPRHLLNPGSRRRSPHRSRPILRPGNRSRHPHRLRLSRCRLLRLRTRPHGNRLRSLLRPLHRLETINHLRRHLTVQRQPLIPQPTRRKNPTPCSRWCS